MDLNNILMRATREHWAVPHFNFSDLVQLKAIVETAKRLNSPVMLGTSEGERDFIGIFEAVALVRSFQNRGYAVFLNADHTKSVEKAKEAIDAGYDSVHIDLSHSDLEENIKGTKVVVEYTRSKNSSISVEGEVGYLPTESSVVHKEVVKIDPELFTKPADAERFVKETGVNRFAAAVGSLHGIAANNPEIDFSLIKKLREALPESIALVLHGGSGVSGEDLQKAIKNGVSNVHISTELRVAEIETLRAVLEKTDDVTPYKLFKPSVDAVAKVVEEKIVLCGSVNKV